MTFTDADKRVLQTALVAGVVALLGLFYYVWAIVNPEIKQLKSAVMTEEADIKVREAELAELKRWEGRAGEIAMIVKELNQKVQRVPKTSDPSEFLRILQECIRRTNLSDLKIVRLKNVPMGAYEEIPYTITCRARYHDLGQFLTLVEQNPQQVMRVKTLDVRNDLKRPSRHNVIVQLATFVFVESALQDKEVAAQ